MKYTAAALGCLNARYRAVLKKCLLINLSLFTLVSPLNVIAASLSNDRDITQNVTVNASDTYTNTENGSITGTVINNGPNFTNNGVIKGGDGTENGAGRIENNENAVFNNNRDIIYSGTGNGSGLLCNRGTLINSGNIERYVTNYGSLQNDGTIKFSAPFMNRGSSSELNNTGTIEVAVFENNGSVINKGEGKITVAAGSSYGVINDGTLMNISNATIKGKVTNNSIFHNQSSIIDGNLTNNAGAEFKMEGGELRGNIENTGRIWANDGVITGMVTNKEGGYIEKIFQVNKKVTNEAGGTIKEFSNLNGDLLNETGAFLKSEQDTVFNHIKGTLTNDGEILYNSCSSKLHVGDKEKKTGSFINNGTATVKGVSYIYGDFKNTGTTDLNYAYFYGNFENNGTVSSSSYAEFKGKFTNKENGKIELQDMTISGDVLENEGTITVTSSTNQDRSKTITINNSGTIKGIGNVRAEINNSGEIEFSQSSIVGNIKNTGTIKINGGGVTPLEKIDNYNKFLIQTSGGMSGPGKFVNHTGAELDVASYYHIQVALENAGIVGNAGYLEGKVTNQSGGTLKNTGEINGNVQNEGTINNLGTINTNEIINKKNATLTSNAEAIVVADNTIQNDGTLDLTSGINTNTISGTGTTAISGNVTNNAGVTQTAVTIAQTGELTTSADTLHLTDSLINDGTLTLTSGTNTNNISGLGKIAILDNFDLGTGTISGNTVEVRNGTLKMSQNNNFDNTATLKVNKGATLDLNDRTATLKEANFAAGSVLKLNVNALDNHGTLNANTITVENGATLKATLAQGSVGYGQPKEIKLLNAENTDFNNFSDEFDNNMYRFEKSGKNGAYAVSLVKTAAEVAKETGASNTQTETAKAWIDGERFNNEKTQEVADKLADLAQNNQAEFVETLETIAPAEAPVVHDMTTDVNDRILQATVDHLKYGAAANMYGMSSGDELSEVSVWGKTYLSQADRDTTSGIQGFKVKSHGVIGGFDKKLNKATKLGVGIQYDTADITSPNRKTDVDSLTGFIYGEYSPDNFFIHWLASYGKADYDENKSALNQKFNANYDAKTYALQGTTGYDLYFNDYKITPEVGLRYYNIHRSSYTDGLSQRVKSQDMDILRAAAGVSVAKDFCVGLCKITPEAYVGLTYDIMEDNDRAVVMLDNGASYTVNGQRLKRLGFETAVGLTAALNDNLDLSISYNGTYRKNYDNHMGLVNIKYKF